MKGILLGNGFNNRIRLEQLDNELIYERFCNNIMRYAPVFWNLFRVRIPNDVKSEIFKNNKNENIESLTKELIDYLRKNNADFLATQNEELYLQDFYTGIGVLSIFYDKTGKIERKFEKDLVLNFENYDKIFSLNYTEFWDEKKEVIYLHGRFDFESLPDEKDIFFIEPILLKNLAYKNAIHEMEAYGKGIVVDTHGLTLAPEKTLKSDLTRHSGLAPSDILYPGGALFPEDSNPLYSQLEGLDELDILGMSPAGDQSLIDKIKKIKIDNDSLKVRVYIRNYKKNADEKKKRWKEALSFVPDIRDVERLI